mmetsp:Transcript_4531/g.13733  ORF Transcript_4531/g.13733 Transcript_4531/m.13733 type:complete len:266 (+) Transcript_4531:101-898(+)|eukprot:CAMPEP_0198729498 /NCGR_PEP_ID=MMETSP1475-20131203/18894_1 /TAXON_ID= ORGANISM="Unidentified sp., Strain CCMP1999" /NCGR_SAMPLE_ID=MMETSP1475 /ASSEMBLY_ACC=CAM_ASM_001111 /LENGTH=265 /DNA_ID=CAMNT_0044492167 /DNA_START=70 /DNA_END=867 /DNA_ORIENTATION=+
MVKKNVRIPTKRSSRRTPGDMRAANLSKGAVLLQYEPHSKASKQAVNNWRIVESKGFFVYETGCVLPDVYYRKKGVEGPARIKAHHAAFVALVEPTFKNVTESERDERGWPVSREISHLCHWNACCNPSHMISEPRWSNWKRLYCGRSGKCDCGMEPQCKQIFHPAAWWDDESHWPVQLRKDLNRIRSLASNKGQFSIEILPSDTYRVEDLKAANRRERRRRGTRHVKQTVRLAQSKKHRSSDSDSKKQGSSDGDSDEHSSSGGD